MMMIRQWIFASKRMNLWYICFFLVYFFYFAWKLKKMIWYEWLMSRYMASISVGIYFNGVRIWRQQWTIFVYFLPTAFDWIYLIYYVLGRSEKRVDRGGPKVFYFCIFRFSLKLRLFFHSFCKQNFKRGENFSI